LDRAIDIKRRAQRSIQSGDLDGALAEYERLVAADDTDPYNYVLLADLFYKKGDHENASRRYLTAASCYEKAGLYKNAIAVGKKMLRLALSPGIVLDRLANLHALDGLSTEATLYYTQYAELMVRENRAKDAALALRKAFDVCTENIKALERLSEVYTLGDDTTASAMVLAEAASYYERAGRSDQAQRCRTRAEQIQAGAVAAFEANALPPPPVARAVGTTAAHPAKAEARGPAAEVGGRMASIDSVRANRPSATPDAEPADLETERPPRFMPPTEERLDAFDVDRHVRAAEGSVSSPGSTPPAAEADEPEPRESMNGAGDAHPLPADLEGVERLLSQAQTEFRAGSRESAAVILARAAQAYEALDRLDNAASIYRSLCKGPHATTEMMELWLRNCEQRDDRREAAQVACELGDRAIQADDLEGARVWFEQAMTFDQNNPVARRRLERLRPAGASAAAPAAPAAPIARVAPKPEPEPATEPELEESAAAPPAPEATEGKVAVALDRGQAVTFDFASMLAEFQRGVETQLSGDTQAHYDLALAYREMGLSEQAIESFRLASKDVNFKQRAAEMIGHCLLEEGRFEDAARELNDALDDSALEPEAAVGIRFQLGLALEAAGRAHEALTEFERVFAIQANYPGVGQKIRDLRKSLEAA
jgi:tetratricopeptide (TPR) repeat protein